MSDEFGSEVPPHPPKYSRGQLVVATNAVRKTKLAMYHTVVGEVLYHLTMGPTYHCTYDGDTKKETTEPPTYLYVIVGVDDRERYSAMEDDIGRYIPSVPEDWEPKESK